MTAVEAALEYAARGWAVLPLAPRSKAPALSRADGGRGWKSATTDPATIEAWWRRDPRRGVGIACVLSGLVALDVDPRNGGDDDLHDLERRHGPLPPTVTNLSGGGGLHLLFRDPGVPMRGNLRPGVEIKRDGYVVAPPSLHPDTGRAYTWSVDGHPSEIAAAELPVAWQHAAAADTPRPRLAVVPTTSSSDDYLLTLTPERYFRILAGVTPGPSGFVRCPLPDHEDRTPSCQVFPTADGGWFCHGCRRGGSIYTLAALLAGIEPPLRGVDFLRVQQAAYRLVEQDASARAAS